MLATGLPIPIIANNFNIFYSYSRVREKLQKRLVRAKKSIIKRNSSLNSSKSSRAFKPNEGGTLTDSHLSNAHSLPSVNLASTDNTDALTTNSLEETTTPNRCIQTNCDFSKQKTPTENMASDETRKTTGLNDFVIDPPGNISQRKPNGILKRQSSLSINCTETKNATTDPFVKTFRRVHSSHSFPLLNSTAKSNEHKLLRRISSVSFQLDDDVFK